MKYFFNPSILLIIGLLGVVGRYVFPAMNEPTIPKIKKAVAEGFQVSVKDIDTAAGVRRPIPVAIARQCVYYYARKLASACQYMDLEREV